VDIIIAVSPFRAYPFYFSSYVALWPIKELITFFYHCTVLRRLPVLTRLADKQPPVSLRGGAPRKDQKIGLTSVS
jgi:hypothetical protein